LAWFKVSRPCCPGAPAPAKSKNASPGAAPLPYLLLSGMGAFAAYSFQNLSLVLATLFGAACLFAPEAGALLALATKPFVDCFWEYRGLIVAGHEFNLQSVVGLAIPFCITIALFVRRELRIRSQVELSALIYVAIVLLSCFRSATPLAAVNSAARMILPFVFLLVGRSFAQRPKRLVLLAMFLCSYGAVPVVTGLMQLSGVIGPPEGAEPMPSGVYRISGFYYHPLDLAVRCSIAIPFAVFLGRALPTASQRSAAILWSALMGAVALATLVRSAIIAGGVQILALLWIARKRAAIVVAAVALASAFVIVPPLRMVFVQALKPLEEGSLYELGTGRGVLFAAQVLGFIDAGPVEKAIGRGLLSGPRVIVEYSPVQLPGLERAYEEGRGMTSHNQILRTLTDSGVLGVAALGFLVFAVASACVRAVGSGSTVEREFAGAALVVLFAIGIYALTTVPLDSPPITWPLWMMVGAILPDSREGS
jgi:hypothetical protein